MPDLLIKTLSAVLSFIVAGAIISLILMVLSSRLVKKGKYIAIKIYRYEIRPDYVLGAVLALMLLIFGLFNYQYDEAVKILYAIVMTAVFIVGAKYIYKASYKDALKLYAAFVGVFILISLVVASLFWLGSA